MRSVIDLVNGERSRWKCTILAQTPGLTLLDVTTWTSPLLKNRIMSSFSKLFCTLCPISFDDTFILPVTSTQNVLVILGSFLFYQTLVSSTESALQYLFHLPFVSLTHHSRISGLHFILTCNSYVTKKNIFTSTPKSTVKLIFTSQTQNLPSDICLPNWIQTV